MPSTAPKATAGAGSASCPPNSPAPGSISRPSASATPPKRSEGIRRIMTEKLWGGRFSQPTDKFVEEFTASIQFDQRLYRYDIQGSIAHCRMLAKQGIIGQDEADTIVAGLREILAEIEHGEFEF